MTIMNMEKERQEEEEHGECAPGIYSIYMGVCVLRTMY